MKKKKLILGTVQFGLNYGINNTKGKPSEDAITEILNTAYTSGIHILDTAEAYGDSQERIGKYHKKGIHQFDVITKFSASVKTLPKNISDRIQYNIQQLQVKQLYCYMFHSFNDFFTYFNDFKTELLQLKASGVLKNIGVSVYTNQEFEQVINTADIDIIQLPFNLLDNTNKRGELLKKAKKKGIEIHTRSAFLQGLFFKNTETLTGNLQELTPTLQKLQNLCSTKNSMADIALNYVYQQETIDYVVIGVDTVAQLQTNLTAVTKNISEEIITTINRIDIEENTLLNPSNWRL